MVSYVKDFVFVAQTAIDIVSLNEVNKWTQLEMYEKKLIKA